MLTTNSLNSASTNKIASAWESGTGYVVLDNGTVASAAQPTGFSGLSLIYMGSQAGGSGFYNGPIARISYFPIKLPNTTMQAITAP